MRMWCGAHGHNDVMHMSRVWSQSVCHGSRVGGAEGARPEAGSRARAKGGAKVDAEGGAGVVV